MRVAIVHYWLVSMRGGEQVLEALCDLYPDADIFTLVCDRDRISDRLKSHRIITSALQRIPGATRNYKKLLPLMPFALEQMDLSGYDLVISSESGPAKGVIVPPDAVHICYCHSPMRYIWDQYHTYRANSGWLSRVMMPAVSPWLRQWDVSTAARVDCFVANSRHVRDRIEKYYRRPAVIINPPVDTGRFNLGSKVGDHYLCAGQLVSYKRVDLAVDVCSRTGRRLIVVGEGEEMVKLQARAAANVTFLGRVSFEHLRDLMQTCRALLFPGEEDFGITPVEAMACGRPVIAYARGGALDTVEAGCTGIHFDRQIADSLEAALLEFEAQEHRFDPQAIRKQALAFDSSLFKERMADLIEDVCAEQRMARTAPGAGGLLAANDTHFARMGAPGRDENVRISHARA